MAEYKGDALDWNYITEQCKQLEIADFEQERRQFAINAFSSDTLPKSNGERTGTIDVLSHSWNILHI